MKVLVKGSEPGLPGLYLVAYDEKTVGKDGKYSKKTKEYHKYFDQVEDLEKLLKDFKKEAKSKL